MIQRSSLFRGSFILLVTLNLFNLLNFIFNVLMARTLSLSEYGELTTIINLVVLFGVFSESIQTIVSKFSSDYSESQSKSFLKIALKKTLSLALVFYLIFLFISLFLSNALSISFIYLSLAGLMILFSFLLPVPRGILQGKQRFSSLGFNFVLEGFVKLFASLILVLLGFRLFGAILGMFLGALSAFCLSFISLSRILNSNASKAKTIGLFDYSRPVFIVNLSIVLFLTLDMVLAKMFFSPEIAGAYAIASTIAKIIFIGTYPLAKALFPISVATKNKHLSEKLFAKSLTYLSILLAFAIIIIKFFSSSIVSLYSGRDIPLSSNILLYLTISMCLLAYTNLILMHSLSRGLLRKYYILIIPLIFEVILLSVFNSNIYYFSLALLTSSAFFLWCSTLLRSEK